MNNGNNGNLPTPIANAPIQNMPTQMLTPINSLPLKTTAQSESDIDDPLIQNVLKEFENEIGGTDIRKAADTHGAQHIQYAQPIQQRPPIQYPEQQMPQYNQASPQFQQMRESLSYEQIKPKSKLFNIDIAKKSAILTIVICILQYTNILKLISNRLPATAVTYISGREYIINILLMFCIIYGAFYTELI